MAEAAMSRMNDFSQTPVLHGAAYSECHTCAHTMEDIVWEVDVATIRLPQVFATLAPVSLASSITSRLQRFEALGITPDKNS